MWLLSIWNVSEVTADLIFLALILIINSHMWPVAMVFTTWHCFEVDIFFSDFHALCHLTLTTICDVRILFNLILQIRKLSGKKGKWLTQREHADNMYNQNSFLHWCTPATSLYFIPSAIHNTGPGSGGHMCMEVRNLYGDEPAEDCMDTPLWIPSGHLIC